MTIFILCLVFLAVFTPDEALAHRKKSLRRELSGNTRGDPDRKLLPNELIISGEGKLRKRRQTQGASPEVEDPECKQADTVGPSSMDCCPCSDCKLGALRPVYIEKCEAILIQNMSPTPTMPESFSTSALNPSTAVNGTSANLTESHASLTSASTAGTTMSTAGTKMALNGTSNASSTLSGSTPLVTRVTRAAASVGEADSSSKHLDEAHKAEAEGFKSIKEMKECLTECVFNESSYLSPNGKLNEQTIMKDFKEGFRDARWAPLAQKVYTKCIDVAKKASGIKCKSGAEEFMNCLAREKYLSCPKEVWNTSNNTECQKAREKLIKCPNSIPNF